MEKRDLYDENRTLLNKTILSTEEPPVGTFILIVIAFLKNLDNKFLIQKRSEIKGGQWAFTGGHPKSGETSLEGIYTEVKEEIGLVITNPILIKELKGKDRLCDLYYTKQDFELEDLILQAEEVSDCKFATEEEIHKMYEDGIFKKGHYKMFHDCLDYLRKEV